MWALRSKNAVVALICLQATICLPRIQKPFSECHVIKQYMGQQWCGMGIAQYLMQSQRCVSCRRRQRICVIQSETK